MTDKIPTKQYPFTISGRIKSFRYAIQGLATMLKSQHNAWVHALATGIVCFVGLLLELTRWDWCWIALAIVAVWIAEALNTSLEFLANIVCPMHHPLVKQAKDVAAGAVLISAVGSVVIGTLVIIPRALEFIETIGR